MADLDIAVSNGRITIAAPFALKDMLKAIPGATWSKPERRWTYPATPSAANSILDLCTRLEEAGFKSIQTDLKVRQLMSEGMTQAQAADHKTANELPEIPNSKTLAWHHQKQAFWFGKDLRAVMLAMDMGTGKSKVAVDLATDMDAQRILVLCPKSAIGVWGREFNTHSSRSVIVCPSGPDIKRFDRLAVRERVKAMMSVMTLARNRHHPVAIVSNYDAAWRDPFNEFAKQMKFDLLILDESHRIKAPGGKASIYCAGLARTIPRKIALTGTPMPHSPLDVYAQYRALDPGIYGNSYTTFKSRFSIPGGYLNKQVIGYQNQEELNRLFYSIAHRVMSEDVQKDLPPMLFERRTCRLGTRGRRAYSELKAVMIAAVGEGVVTAKNALTKLLRLQQITSGFVRLDDGEGESFQRLMPVDSSKRELLVDILEDIHPDEPVVVFARFHHDLDTIAEAAKETGRTYGEISGRQKDLTPEATMPEGITLMGVQISAGGVGIDLTRARFVLYYSVGFNLGDYLQSIKRVHRPGQTKNTYFMHLVAEDTVDEKVYQTLQERQDVVTAILADLRGEQNG